MSTETLPEREEGWLDCRLDKGMFSDEVAVTYPSTGDWKKSVFVPSETVKGLPGSRGQVQVTFLRRGNKLFAVLPSPRRDIVEVLESDRERSAIE